MHLARKVAIPERMRGLPLCFCMRYYFEKIYYMVFGCVKMDFTCWISSGEAFAAGT